MAVAKMAKVMIVSHRSEAGQLLEELQSKGIMEILDVERAIVSKDWPELAVEGQVPRDIEELVSQLSKSISFLEQYSETKKGLLNALSPKTIVDRQQYHRVISGDEALQILDQTEQCISVIEQLQAKKEKIISRTEMLQPWKELTMPLDEMSDSQRTAVLPGLLPSQNVKKVSEQLTNLSAVVETVGVFKGSIACVVICLKEDSVEVQKVLRSADFEQVTFEQSHKTAAELIEQDKSACGGLTQITEQLDIEKTKAAELSRQIIKLQILADHYQNLSVREHTQAKVPVTEHTVFLEGWVREKDYKSLEDIVSKYPATDIGRIKPIEGEEVPVDIENKPIIKPFEVITRLYGMPQVFEVDPTVFIAPFFALFFGFCLGDAGYGLATIAISAYLIKKMQGDKKLIWMLAICSVFAVIFGALTGGWFGDAIDQFAPAGLINFKKRLMLFDPLAKPELLVALALALGYIQLMSGLIIAFVHNLKQRNYTAALCDQLTWLVMLNSVVIFGFSKAGVLVSANAGKFFAIPALIAAAMILLLSSRDGSWGARLGMGFYNLFSSIFYMGDVLSYLRLMGLAMVGAGMAMAVNLIAKITLDIPYGIGIVLTVLILIGGHGFNLVLSLLGAFVHTMRLQYVEFFPKFFVGGGRAFEPLHKEYKHISIKNTQEKITG
jgi:V/A-type H+-transporting ATPase subunit I